MQEPTEVEAEGASQSSATVVEVIKDKLCQSKSDQASDDRWMSPIYYIVIYNPEKYI